MEPMPDSFIDTVKFPALRKRSDGTIIFDQGLSVMSYVQLVEMASVLEADIVYLRFVAEYTSNGTACSYKDCIAPVSTRGRCNSHQIGNKS